MTYPNKEVTNLGWWKNRSRTDILAELVTQFRDLCDGENFKFSSRSSLDAVSPLPLHTDTAQAAAYWLNLYGRLLSDDVYVTVADIAENLAVHRRREEWIRHVSEPTEDRLSREYNIGFHKFLSLLCEPAMTDEETETAYFWLMILNASKRRFLDHKPLVAENPPDDAPICPYCYAQVATEQVRGGVEHTLCLSCYRTNTVEVADQPGTRWLRSACFSAYTMDRTQVWLSLEAPAGMWSQCPACRSKVVAHPLEECPRCGWSVIGHIVNQNHRAAPPPNTLRSPKECANLSPEYFGVELEVECPVRVPKNATLAKIYDPSSMCIKHDGSLENGAEIVTVPATFRWWMEHEEEWTKRLDTLRTAGFRSYDSGRCGMHIHIDRRAFTPSSLLKLMELIYGDGKELFMNISQRSDFTYCSFSAQDAIHRSERIGKAISALDGDRSDRAADAKLERARQAGPYDAPFRRVAVNVPTAHPTVELRFFRGTLNAASFWKNVECAKALLDFVSTHSMAEMTTAKFVAYVGDNALRFRHLQAFLTKLKKNGPPKLRKSRPQKMKPEVTEQDFAEAAC